MGHPYLMYPAILQGEGAEVFFFGHTGLLSEGIRYEVRRGLLRAGVGRVSGRKDEAIGCAESCCERRASCVIKPVRRRVWLILLEALREVRRCPGSIRRWVVVGAWFRLVVVAAWDFSFGGARVQGGEGGSVRAALACRCRGPESKWDKSANLDELRRCQRTKGTGGEPGKGRARTAKNP